MEVKPSPEIWHRGDFYLVAEWRQYKRVVEVGVDRGEFAQCFLERWINKEIYVGVDPYLPYDELPFDREADFETAVARLARFGGFCRLLRATSREVATSIQATLGEFYWTLPYDLVYIDGRHAYESVLEDLHLWWPIVSEGGMLAGHDWFDAGRNDNQGVQKAVREFASSVGTTIYYTWGDSPQSWYFYKGAEPIQRIKQ